MQCSTSALFSSILIGTVALTGCNGSSTPSPRTTSTPAIANVSGDYTGTTQDSVLGAGTAAGTLAQSGTSAGGAITITAPSATVTAQVALSINASNALAGSMVIDFSNGTTCTFSTTGTYANNGSNSAVLSGSYSATTNCSGETGTFTLNQQCTDTVTSGDRRIMAFPAPC